MTRRSLWQVGREVQGVTKPITAALVSGCIERNAELLRQEQLRRTNAEAKNGACRPPPRPPPNRQMACAPYTPDLSCCPPVSTSSHSTSSHSTSSRLHLLSTLSPPDSTSSRLRLSSTPHLHHSTSSFTTLKTSRHTATASTSMLIFPAAVVSLGSHAVHASICLPSFGVIHHRNTRQNVRRVC